MDDPVFETFLRAWTKERIWPTDDFLDGPDQQYMAERRAIELIQLAKERGFGEKLGETVKPDGSVLAYVKHLMWNANYQAARSRNSNESTEPNTASGAD
jgi:hypothetical protein